MRRVKFHEWTRLSGMVPTAIGYGVGDSGSVKYGYGALAAAFDEEFVVFTRFKGNVEDETVAPTNPIHEQQKLYRPANSLRRDFLRWIYSNVQDTFGLKCPKGTPPWNEARVNFVFSVPAAGDVEVAAADMRHCAEHAGYSTHQQHRIVMTSPTESAAAAAYFLRKDKAWYGGTDQTVLVIDVGGGTSDLCLFCVSPDAASSGPIASGLAPVAGDNIGSAHIDKCLEDIMAAHFAAVDQDMVPTPSFEYNANFPGEISPKVRRDARKLAWGDEVQNFKQRFGNGEERTITLARPDDKARANERLSAETIELPVSTMKACFDGQIAQLRNQVDTVLEDIFTKWDLLPRKHQENKTACLDKVLLSGGLGSSPYVSKEITAMLRADGASKYHENAKGVQIHVCQEPQLCVVYGTLLLAMRDASDADGQGRRGRTAKIVREFFKSLRGRADA